MSGVEQFIQIVQQVKVEIVRLEKLSLKEAGEVVGSRPNRALWEMRHHQVDQVEEVAGQRAPVKEHLEVGRGAVEAMVVIVQLVGAGVSVLVVQTPLLQNKAVMEEEVLRVQ